MAWMVTIFAAAVTWFIYRKNTGDSAVKKVQGITLLLEREATRLADSGGPGYQALVDSTIALRIGIHALKHDQSALVSDEVVGVYRQVASGNHLLFGLASSLPASTVEEIQSVFRQCYERLYYMQHEGYPLSDSSLVQDFKPSTPMPSGAFFAQDKPTECPCCESHRVVEVLYGYPSAESFQEAAQGRLVLGGRMHQGDSAEWQCVDCKSSIAKGIEVEMDMAVAS